MTRNQELIIQALQRLGEERRQNQYEARIIATRLTALAHQALDAGISARQIAKAAGVVHQTIYTLTASTNKSPNSKD